MVIVVSDTSPIRALAHLGWLGLLQTFYGNVFLPPAVEEELSHTTSTAGSVDLTPWPFIQVQKPQNQTQVQQLRQELDPGESEPLALALEIGAAGVLIDEARGRRAAKQLGLVVIGTLGILVRAKQQGLVHTVRPLLDSLQTELNFFVSPELREEVLLLAGEKDVPPAQPT